MNRFSPSFFIGSISIGTVEGASCVNLGNNLPSGFTNFKKHNQGFGNISGDHTNVHDILASLEENDSDDMFRNELGNETDFSDISQIAQDLMMNNDLDIKEQNHSENETNGFEND
ncbi:hypothetical protein [Neobacillus sp. D3-1R]|uniref:hypothetical protein n=1 Tax=Neobacillus sp. D3-1R TaxID=3445778 RepID=UPI003FA0C5C6